MPARIKNPDGSTVDVVANQIEGDVVLHDLISRTIAANNTTGILIKATAGVVTGFYLSNVAVTKRYVKFYDKATAPSVGTDTPVLTIAIPGCVATNPDAEVVSISMPRGIKFVNGIGIGITNLQADNDTTAPTAADVVANIFYN